MTKATAGQDAPEQRQEQHQEQRPEDRIGDRVRAGRDAMVVGDRDRVRAALAGSVPELALVSRVVRAVAPAGGLSLSALMAQLSGRDDLGEQDDSVLEEVFRLLSGNGAPEGRAVLMIDAVEGLQRSVLQYIHQAGRILPSLSFVIGAESVPSALEEAPGLVGLRSRLLRDEPIVLPAAPVAVPARPRLVAGRRAARRAAPMRQERRSGLSWALTGTGMVASLMVGVIVGHATTPRAVREAWPSLMRAMVPAPSAATLAAAEAARPSEVGLATVAGPRAAEVPTPMLAARIVPEAVRPETVKLAVLPAQALPAPSPAPARPAPATVAIGLLQEGGAADTGWSGPGSSAAGSSGPGRVLNERGPARRWRQTSQRPRMLAPPVGGAQAGEAQVGGEESPLSPAQVEEVRSHFGRGGAWEAPPPYMPYPPSDDDNW